MDSEYDGQEFEQLKSFIYPRLPLTEADGKKTERQVTMSHNNGNSSIIFKNLKFSQYSSIHTNYIIPNCTTLQYNHNI